MTKKEKYEYLMELAKYALEDHQKMVNFMTGFNPVKQICMCPQCVMLREVVK